MSNQQMNGDPMEDWRFGFEVKSDQLGAADTGDGKTYTITGISFRKVGDKGKEKMRPIVQVRESDLEWVTCKTTLFCLEAMFGRSPRNWLGKRVTLYWDPKVKFGRETVGGVRVKGSPEIRDMTVTVKLPKKASQEIRLFNTAPRQQSDPAEARAKFIAYAEGKGVTVEQVEAFLASHGTTLAEQGPDNLRKLAHDLQQVRAFAAESAAPASTPAPPPASNDDGGLGF